MSIDQRAHVAVKYVTTKVYITKRLVITRGVSRPKLSVRTGSRGGLGA